MRRFKVSKIQWETDGCKVKLPKTAFVEVGDDDDEDVVVDTLSDEYGWLISGCYIEEIVK